MIRRLALAIVVLAALPVVAGCGDGPPRPACPPGQRAETVVTGFVPVMMGQNVMMMPVSETVYR